MVGNMLGLLINYEEMLSQLYRAFSETIPEQHDFWSLMAGDEDSRTNLMRNLESEVAHQRAEFNNQNFNPISVRRALDYIKNQADTVRIKPIPPITALTIALDIEKSVVYNRIFESFKGYTTRNRQLIREQGDAENIHFQSLESAWNERRTYPLS